MEVSGPSFDKAAVIIIRRVVSNTLELEPGLLAFLHPAHVFVLRDNLGDASWTYTFRKVVRGADRQTDRQTEGGRERPVIRGELTLPNPVTGGSAPQSGYNTFCRGSVCVCVCVWDGAFTQCVVLWEITNYLLQNVFVCVSWNRNSCTAHVVCFYKHGSAKVFCILNRVHFNFIDGCCSNKSKLKLHN